MIVGDIIRIDLTDLSLEGAHCPARPGEPWFNDEGEVRIDFNNLKPTTWRSSHKTTRTDTREGGWTRKMDVSFNPYLDDEKVRMGKWIVVDIEKRDEYEHGPGGNGSYTPNPYPIGKSTWITCDQGPRRLRFVCDWSGYHQYVPLERIKVVDHVSPDLFPEGCP